MRRFLALALLLAASAPAAAQTPTNLCGSSAGCTARLSAADLNGLLGTKAEAVATVAALRAWTPTSGTSTGFAGTHGNYASVPASVIVAGYAAAGDGGGDRWQWSAASTATDDGCAAVKPASVSGAGRWLHVVPAAGLDLRSCGADPTGATDSAAAITAAVALASSRNAEVRVIGTFAFASGLTVTDTTLRGVGPGASALLATFASGDAITLGLNGRLTGVQLGATVTRTSGFSVLMTANGNLLTDFVIANAHSPVGVVGADNSHLVINPRIQRGNIFLPSTANLSTQVGITLTNFGGAIIEDVQMGGTASGAQPSASAYIRNGDTVYIANCNWTRYGTFKVIPSSGENLYALTIINSTFDSSAADAADIMPQGGVYNTLIANSWFGLAATSGLVVAPQSGGTVKGLVLTGNQYVASAADDGVHIAGPGTVESVQITGGLASGNSGWGVSVAAGSHIQVNGLRAGNADARGVNGNGGIATSGSVDYYVITGNDTNGNSGTNLSDGASGTHKVVANNLQ